MKINSYLLARSCWQWSIGIPGLYVKCTYAIRAIVKTHGSLWDHKKTYVAWRHHITGNQFFPCSGFQHHSSTDPENALLNPSSLLVFSQLSSHRQRNGTSPWLSFRQDQVLNSSIYMWTWVSQSLSKLYCSQVTLLVFRPCCSQFRPERHYTISHPTIWKYCLSQRVLLTCAVRAFIVFQLLA